MKSGNFILWWMADNEEGREAPPRGNEWEVVSLTASAYAAAPGPKQVELNDDDKDHSVGEDKGETSEAMFMSHHFVFPPSQHENLHLELEKTKIHNQQEDEDAIPEFVAEEGGKSNTKDGENWDVKALNMSEDFPGIQFVDEKGKILSVSRTEFEEGMAFEGLNLVDKEQSIYSTANYSSVHGEATMGGSIAVEENRTTAEPIDLSEEGLDSEISPSPKSIDKNKDDGSQLPCEAWWKRRASSLYAHAKEANAVWSIVVAAAVMGLVILGQRWQQERWQVLQLKWQFGINDEVCFWID